MASNLVTIAGRYLADTMDFYEWMGNSTRQKFEIRLWKILIG